MRRNCYKQSNHLYLVWHYKC